MKNDIKYLFEPRAFAVIGASNDTSKLGHSITRNLINGGYAGKIYPVNPNGGDILGIKVYKNIKDIDGEIDSATLVIPAGLCAGAVRECAGKGVKYLQIITSGFSESGNHREEAEIVEIAKSAGMRLLGPNIFGVYSAASSMNSTFSATDILKGNVAILTQSGALGIAMIGRTAVDNIGLSAIVSTGNKCDIDESDLLEYLVDDASTKVILMYMEGVKNGERLIRILKKTCAVKPVIAIKSGRSRRGAMAAASHTGSLAGSDAIFDAVMKQCGVLRADSLEEGFAWCRFLSTAPKPADNRTVIVTNGGGIGVLATDACEKNGITLFDDQIILRETFEKAVPSYGSTRNPVDITGGAMAKDYDLALSAPASSPYMDSTLALYCETAAFDSDNLVPMIRSTWRKHLEAGKPVSYAVVGGESVENAISILRKENIPVFNDVNPAVSCMGALYRYYSLMENLAAEPAAADIDVDTINTIVYRVLAGGRKFLLANEAQEVMNAAGIPIPSSSIVKSLNEAVYLANGMGFPLVMKVVSRDIIHKSDAGGLALDLQNIDEVMSAYEAIVKNCRAYNPSAVIEGVEIAEMVKPGLELVVGGIRDASFGPVVMFGLGGIYVEVMKDVSFRSYPLSLRDARSMLEDIRTYPLLLGVRGEERKDIDGIIEAIVKVGAILAACPAISDIEINPLVAYEQSRGIKALDVRILLKNVKI
jgi:acetyltransferase